MLKLFCLAASLLLSACAGPLAAVPAMPGSPADMADRTTLDERAALSVEAAYAAARATAELAADAGWVNGDTASRLLAADERAYAAVQAVRAAYDAGNAASYSDLARQALPAIAGLLDAAKGR